MSYASQTTVPIERTRVEIEALLRQAGATGIFGGWDDRTKTGQVVCRLKERMIRFRITLPALKDFMKTPTGRSRNTADATSAMQQEERRKWRALLLIIKAKLEMIESGDSTVDREFLADLMLPDGSTVYESAGPAIVESYKTGIMPRLLGSGS